MSTKKKHENVFNISFDKTDIKHITATNILNHSSSRGKADIIANALWEYYQKQGLLNMYLPPETCTDNHLYSTPYHDYQYQQIPVTNQVMPHQIFQTPPKAINGNTNTSIQLTKHSDSTFSRNEYNGATNSITEDDNNMDESADGFDSSDLMDILNDFNGFDSQ